MLNFLFIQRIHDRTKDCFVVEILFPIMFPQSNHPSVLQSHYCMCISTQYLGSSNAIQSSCLLSTMLIEASYFKLKSVKNRQHKTPTTKSLKDNKLLCNLLNAFKRLHSKTILSYNKKYSSGYCKQPVKGEMYTCEAAHTHRYKRRLFLDLRTCLTGGSQVLPSCTQLGQFQTWIVRPSLVWL